jgi:arginine utilization protein RocB
MLVVNEVQGPIPFFVRSRAFHPNETLRLNNANFMSEDVVQGLRVSRELAQSVSPESHKVPPVLNTTSKQRWDL